MYLVVFVFLVVDSVVINGLSCVRCEMGDGVVNDVSWIAMGDV